MVKEKYIKISFNEKNFSKRLYSMNMLLNQMIHTVLCLFFIFKNTKNCKKICKISKNCWFFSNFLLIFRYFSIKKMYNNGY